MVKKILIIIILLTVSQPYIRGGTSDTLHLQYCYSKAREISPLRQQELLNQSIYELNYKNSGNSYLPSLYLSGKATYQSEVITIPGLSMVPEFPEIPKEQFNISLNLRQNIYDGGLSKYSRQVDDAQLRISEMELESQLFQIHEIINQLYFAILQGEERRKILIATLETIEEQRETIASRVKNGVLLPANLQNIEKQVLTLEQEIISLESDLRAIRIMLSKWIGQPVTEETIILIPDFPSIDRQLPVNRPEIALFESQQGMLEAKSGVSGLSRTPQIYAFAQGGVGQPNPMNFFEVDPSAYYLLGVQINWDIYDWGNTGRKKQSLKVQQEILATRKQDFERSVEIGLIREYESIRKMEEILVKDEEIILLQENIVKSAYSELQNGVITSTEYLTELNSLIQTKINKTLHELNLANTYVKIYTSTGNSWNQNTSENE